MRNACVSILAAAAVVVVPAFAHADRNVQAIRLDAHGRASGLILDDGTELVGLAPMTEQIADAVHAVRVVIGANDSVQIVDERPRSICDDATSRRRDHPFGVFFASARNFSRPMSVSG